MSGYRLMECLIPPGETRMSLADYPMVPGVDSWILGSRFVQVPEQPLKLQWDPETEGAKKTYYDATIPLMRVDLVAALRAAGVDNLDCYATQIQHPVSGEVDSEYLAVNVVGSIRAADLSKSTFADPSRRRRIDMDFDRLALAEEACRGALLFRLGECTTGLLVADRVRETLAAKGGFGLHFVAPEDWIG